MLVHSIEVICLLFLSVAAFYQPLKTRQYSTTCNAAKSLIIWDCDGVLVDSEALLKQGEVEALADLGFSLTVDDCVRLFSGVSPDKAADNFFKEYKVCYL